MIQSLTRELRSLKPHAQPKKKKKFPLKVPLINLLKCTFWLILSPGLSYWNPSLIIKMTFITTKTLPITIFKTLLHFLGAPPSPAPWSPLFLKRLWVLDVSTHLLWTPSSSRCHWKTKIAGFPSTQCMLVNSDMFSVLFFWPEMYLHKTSLASVSLFWLIL